MKTILFISLFLNIILGIGYFHESGKPPIERVVIESHEGGKPQVVEKKVFVKVPSPSSGSKILNETTQSKSADNGFVEFDEVAVEQVVEKVSADRETYLQEELNVAPEDLKKIERIKKKYYEEADKLMKNMSYGAEPTIEQRRQLIELEEAREFEFAEALGPSKFEKFKSYREDYNRKNMKRQEKDHGVFIPMEL